MSKLKKELTVIDGLVLIIEKLCFKKLQIKKFTAKICTHTTNNMTILIFHCWKMLLADLESVSVLGKCILPYSIY